MLRLFAKSLLSIKKVGIKMTFKKVISRIRKLILSYMVDTTYECEYQENIDFQKYEPNVYNKI
jgi:hypothetical protein